jgi:hypothetical protein
MPKQFEVTAEQSARGRALFTAANERIDAGEWSRDSWIQLLRDVQAGCPALMEAALAKGMNPDFPFADLDDLPDVMQEVNASSSAG